MSIVTAEQRQRELTDQKAYESAKQDRQVAYEEAVKRVRYTKQLVLEGVVHREEVPVPELGEDAHLIIRPLTDEEFTEVTRKLLEGASMTGFGVAGMELGDVVDREQRGTYHAVSIALSVDGDKWSPEDVGKLPVGVPKRIYEKLSQISGFPRPPTPAQPEKAAPRGKQT